MTQKISSTNIETSTLISLNGPSIANVSIANSTYVLLDDTAVSNAGGFAVITGTNFVSGAQVLFGNTAAPSVTFVNSTRLNVQVPALTAGSYVMYIQNPDGSTGIRINALTSSPIPVWSTGSTLTNQSANAPISISLSAPSDSNVTFSVANGSSLPAGTTLAANGLFSGTVSISTETTYNFSVNAIDAENQEALRSFSVTVQVGEPYFNLTTLLLAGDGTNNANNNVFQDSSTNNFTITRNGNTTQGSFSPFSQTGWSNFFGGNGNYAVSNADVFTSSTSTFTIEGWIYPTAAAVSGSNIPSVIGDMQPTSTAAYWTFGILASGALSFYWYDGAGKSATSNGTVSLNTWTHIAVSVNANAITLYINGVQQTLTGTTTLSNRTGSNSSVAFAQFSNTGSVFTGYLSNISVLSGTAKYSSSFTPSTTPLATGTTNQVLLFAAGNRFADFNTATTAKTFTITGTPSVQAFSPFLPTVAYTPQTIGGSGYFDGSDYLSVPDNVAFTMGAGDFCLEAWVYVTAASGAQLIFGTCDSAGTQSSMSFVLIAQTSSGFPAVGVGYAGTMYYATSSDALVKNQWNHIAGVRNGATVTIYVNGVSKGTLNMGTLAITDSTQIVGIGRNGNGNFEYLTGYIASARIVKGSPVYTANFTPPTAPLTAITNTQLLLNFTNAGITDATAKNVLETVGDAKISTAQSKFGGSSMLFDGTDDRLKIPYNPNLLLGSSNFTVEMWLYKLANIAYMVAAGNLSAPSSAAWALISDVNGNLISWYTNGNFQMTSTTSLATSTWYHLAITRSGTTGRLFINGVQESTWTDSVNYNVTNDLFIGNDAQLISGRHWNGYIEDFRITRGFARYTANFTPPTSAFLTR
jgi:hypothetical protein